MTAAEQARAFLAMALCGIACAIAYDALAALRRMVCAGRVMTAALDVGFGVICALGMTATALQLQIEPFRLYAFAGVALGTCLYMVTIGTGVRRFGRWMGRIVKKSGMTSKKCQNDAGKSKSMQNNRHTNALEDRA